jgi:hypothetical protein
MLITKPTPRETSPPPRNLCKCQAAPRLAFPSSGAGAFIVGVQAMHGKACTDCIQRPMEGRFCPRPVKFHCGTPIVLEPFGDA